MTRGQHLTVCEYATYGSATTTSSATKATSQQPQPVLQPLRFRNCSQATRSYINIACAEEPWKWGINLKQCTREILSKIHHPYSFPLIPTHSHSFPLIPTHSHSFPLIPTPQYVDCMVYMLDHFEIYRPSLLHSYVLNVWMDTAYTWSH